MGCTGANVLVLCVVLSARLAPTRLEDQVHGFVPTRQPWKEKVIVLWARCIMQDRKKLVRGGLAVIRASTSCKNDLMQVQERIVEVPQLLRVEVPTEVPQTQASALQRSSLVRSVRTAPVAMWWEKQFDD
eukprot:1892921-Amphidinium_carterae.1